jgi:hypothetical protein
MVGRRVAVVAMGTTSTAWLDTAHNARRSRLRQADLTAHNRQGSPSIPP